MATRQGFLNFSPMMPMVGGYGPDEPLDRIKACRNRRGVDMMAKYPELHNASLVFKKRVNRNGGDWVYGYRVFANRDRSTWPHNPDSDCPTEFRQ